ncbi:hypothetical protein B4113_2026 [Geobacillus sp. B4113_201601]|nr:hypothetical protein B4113_2026 [Geobacillus sp. B4113_201601]
MTESSKRVILRMAFKEKLDMTTIFGGFYRTYEGLKRV